MTQGRQFLKQRGALGVSMAAAAAALPVRADEGSAGQSPKAVAPENSRSSAAHAWSLPSLTLLSMRHSGRGGESLGIKFDDGVFDVAQASALLAMPVPLTLGQRLRDGGWPDVETHGPPPASSNVSHSLVA